MEHVLRILDDGQVPVKAEVCALADAPDLRYTDVLLIDGYDDVLLSKDVDLRGPLTDASICLRHAGSLISTICSIKANWKKYFFFALSFL